MSPQGDPNLTLLLDRIRAGDSAATGQLLNAAYADLRALAAHLFGGETPGHTLQPTALVHELCLRLLAHPPEPWSDRKHFFRAAARAMRNLLTDHARARNAQRRGGPASRIPLESLDAAAATGAVDLVTLDETISRLSRLDERLGEVFELRFLMGLSVDQTARICDRSPRTIESDTQFIRAWIHKELRQ